MPPRRRKLPTTQQKEPWIRVLSYPEPLYNHIFRPRCAPTQTVQLNTMQPTEEFGQCSQIRIPTVKLRGPARRPHQL